MVISSRFCSSLSEVKTAPVGALAVSVHVFTACGAGLALLAMIAAVAQNWALMFVWLGAALLIDGVDGLLARAVDTPNNAPRWSGAVLDLVVDFTTYVFVPAYAIVSSGLMPPQWAVPSGFIIAVTAALYFADRNMKATDNHFVGFPAVWNVVAFYLLLVRPELWITVTLIAVFAVMTFLPIRFVHPIRVQRMRWVNLGVLVLWGILAAIALMEGLSPQPWITVALCLIAVYFLLAGLVPARSRMT
jgi:phosphatidylcholine synthase